MMQPRQAGGFSVDFREGWAAFCCLPPDSSNGRAVRVPLDTQSVVVEGAHSPLLPVRLRSSEWLSSGSFSSIEVLIRKALELRGREWISSAAVAVPVQMPTDVRQQCKTAAAAAGVPQLQMLDRDVALALATAESKQLSVANTLLLQVGYDRTDISLARIAQGAVRILDRLSIEALSLSVLDEVILAQCCKSVQSTPGPLSEWRACWQDVEQIRIRLNALPKIRYYLAARNWRKSCQAEFTHEELFPWLRSDLMTVLAAAERLINDNRLAWNEIHRLILCGGGPLCWPAGVDLVREKLSVDVCEMGLDRVAVGAGRYALDPDPEVLSQLRIRHEPVTAIEGDSSARKKSLYHDQAAVQSLPRAAADGAGGLLSPIDGLWQYLRTLAGSQPAEAVRIATQLRDQLDGFLQVPTSPPPARATDERHDAAWSALRQAQRLLEQGFAAESVQMSHAAMNQVPGDAQIFRAMLDLHVAAADAAPDAKTAIAWLRCAHAHDESDRRVHQLLGEQYLRLSDELANSGQLHQALEAVQESLTFAPADAAARQRKAQLQQQAAQLGPVTRE